MSEESKDPEGPDIQTSLAELEFEEQEDYRACQSCKRMCRTVFFKDGKRLIPANICFACFEIGINFGMGKH